MIMVIGDNIFMGGVKVATIFPGLSSTERAAFVEAIDMQETREPLGDYCPNCEVEYERGFEDGKATVDA